MDALRERPLASKRQRSVSVESGEESPSLDGDQPPSGEKSQRVDYFPASKLFEYQWPLGVEGADFYILQEHVVEFLDIRGLQRKYPDISRRNVDLDERKYLMGRGVVTEMQSNMGLVALRSEEVMEVMMEDYPSKYVEYREVVQERHFQATLHTKIMEARRVAVMAESQPEVLSSEATRMAVRDAANYNCRLADIRRNFSSSSVDLQTNVIQVPRAPPVVSPTPKMSRYPVALLPGQYSDYVRKYTPAELSRLPLNTVTDFSALEDVVKPVETQPSSLSSQLPGTTPIRPFLSSLLTPGLTPGGNSARLSSSSTQSLPRLNFSLPSAILSAIFSKAIQASSSSTAEVSVSHKSPLPANLAAGLGLGAKEDERSKVGGSVASMDRSSVASSDAGTSALSVLDSNDGVSVDSGSVRGQGLEGDSREGGGNSGSEVDVVGGRSERVGVASTPPAPSPVGVGQSTEVVQSGRGTSSSKFTLCAICFKGRSCNKLGKPEDLMTCTSCSCVVHPSCYDLSSCTVLLAKSYPWQCLNCKTCQLCSDSGHDDQMMCCDMCDRGYHSFCVGLQQIPSGHWWCKLCTSCASCGRGSDHEGGVVMDKRGEESEDWKNEFYHGAFVQTLCRDCSSYYRSGYFCPVCLKVYHNDETDSPMVCCDACDRWIHTDCDSISADLYAELSQEEKSTYLCSLCQGKLPDRVDQYHRKHKKISNT